MVDGGFCDGTFYISWLRSVTKSSIVSVLVHANRFPIDWFAIFLSSLADTPFVGAQYRRLIAKKGNSPHDLSWEIIKKNMGRGKQLRRCAWQSLDQFHLPAIWISRFKCLEPVDGRWSVAAAIRALLCFGEIFTPFVVEFIKCLALSSMLLLGFERRIVLLLYFPIKSLVRYQEIMGKFTMCNWNQILVLLKVTNKDVLPPKTSLESQW